MDPTVHVVDPDYDTVVVLKSPSTKFAGVETLVKTTDSPKPRLSEWNENGASYAESSPETAQSEAPADAEDRETHYHVSSRHLQIASPWFRRAMAKEGWAESKLKNGYYQVLARDWDEEAFLMLLNIFHLRNRQVPRVISLEMLAKVAVLVDYYECSEAIELFTDMWIDEVAKDAIPTTYCRDLVLWIWISWVFGLSDCLEKASTVAIKEGREAMDTLELPIPTAVSGEIDLRRYQAIEAVLDGLHTLLDKYLSSSYTCTQSNVLSFQCGSFMLGALMKELDGCSLLSPRPEIPFQDISFCGICVKVRQAKSPIWWSTQSNGGFGISSNQHKCNLQKDVAKIVDAAIAGVLGLSLSQMRGTSEVVEAVSQPVI